MNARSICIVTMLLVHCRMYADLPQTLGVLRDSLENLSSALRQPEKKSLGANYNFDIDKAIGAKDIDAVKELAQEQTDQDLYLTLIRTLQAGKDSIPFAEVLAQEFARRGISKWTETSIAKETMLMMFVSQDNLPAVEFLLTKGANPEATDVRGNRVLDFIQPLRPNAENIKDLLRKAIYAKKSGPISFSSKQEALDKLASTNLTDLAEQELQEFNKAFVSKVGKKQGNKDSKGETFLTAAIKSKFDNAALQFALDGVEFDTPNSDGLTPLMMAARVGNKDLVNALLTQNVGLAKIENNGYTALFYALLRDHLDIAQLLVYDGIKKAKRPGINLDAVDKDGTPMIVAFAAQNNVAAVKFLIDNGADVNKIDKDGMNALAVANSNVKNKQPNAQQIVDLLEGKTSTTIGKEFTYKTFKDWYAACQQLPLHSDLKYDAKGNVNDSAYTNAKQKVLSSDELLRAFNAFRDMIKQELRDSAANWIGGNMLPDNLFPADITQEIKNIPFEPFVVRQKFNATTKFIIQGDRHGDVHSLLYLIRELQEIGRIERDSFKLVSNDLNLVFLGDTVDRGIYSLETVYTLIRLKLANPGRVFLIRGNHEDWLTARDYGLLSEITATYPDEKKQDLIIYAFINYFNWLPAALYLGCGNNYVQCCHGGIEVGYNPKKLLSSTRKYEYISKVNRQSNIATMKLAELSTDLSYEFALGSLENDTLASQSFGLTWSDFAPNDDVILQEDTNTGRLRFGKEFSKRYLAFANSSSKVVLQGFLRAHQHARPDSGTMMEKILNPITPGLAKIWETTTQANKYSLWPNIVCTFNIAPNTITARVAADYFKDYGTTKGVIKDFYGMLTVADKFEDWRLVMHEIDHPTKK